MACLDACEVDPLVWAWAEKLRRFVELPGPKLAEVAAERFGRSDWRGTIGGAALLLAKAAAVRKSASPERLPDLAYLNAACRALDAADGFYASSAEAKILVKSSLAAARIVISDRRPPAAEQPAIPGHGTVQVFHDGNDAAAPFRVVVIGRPGSLYTAVSLQLLQRAGVTVSALVAVTGPAQRRLVDRDRTYSRRVPLARWAHVLPFAHRARFNNRKASPALLSFARELGVGWRAMTSLNSGSGIQLLQVGTLADLRILELLERTRPHALVYRGAGSFRRR